MPAAHGDAKLQAEIDDLKKEAALLRQAVRDLVTLESRFKPPSFDRSPMPALQEILAQE